MTEDQDRQDKWEFVAGEPLYVYPCGLNVGDKITLKTDLMVAESDEVLIRKGELWSVLPGTSCEPELIWFRDPLNERHTWDDHSIWHDFEKAPPPMWKKTGVSPSITVSEAITEGRLNAARVQEELSIDGETIKAISENDIELELGISIAAVCKISSMLKISLLDFLGIDYSGKEVPIKKLRSEVESFMQSNNLDFEDLSTLTGWNVRGMLDDKDLLLEHSPLRALYEVCFLVNMNPGGVLLWLYKSSFTRNF